jgi:hypothetical protein
VSYACAYGSPGCREFSTTNGSRWHSSCAPGRAVTLSNHLLKTTGASVRPLIAPGSISDAAETIAASVTVDEDVHEFERLHAASLLAAVLSDHLGIDPRDRPKIATSLATALGVEIIEDAAKTTDSRDIARFVSIELKDVDRAAAPGERIEAVVERFGLARRPQEAFWVIAYDAMMQTRTVVEVARGGFHDVTVPIPALLMAVLTAASDRFQVAHNHPSGDVRPSKADVALTARIMDAANTLGLYFEDHLIVGPGGAVWSFVDHDMLVPATISGHELAPIPKGKR